MTKNLVLVYALSLPLTHSLAPPLAPGKLFQFCALVAVCGVDCSTALQERKEEREKEKRGQRERERERERERVMAKPLQTLALLGSLRTLLFLFNVLFWVSEIDSE